MPTPGNFVRSADNGWVVVQRAVRLGRDDVDLPWWQTGTHGAIELRAWATFPAAERLAAQLELDDVDFALEVAPPFVAPGQTPGYRQFRGPEDDERVLEDVRRYAVDTGAPAVDRNARLDAWMAAHAAPSADGLERASRTVPMMLLAHGRTDEAVRHLEKARTEPELADDEAFVTFAKRAIDFVRSGSAVATDGTVLRAVAERRAAAAKKARPADAADELPARVDDDKEPLTGWAMAVQRVGTVVLIVTFAALLLGKIGQVVEFGPGWGWIPVATMAGLALLKLAETSGELRAGWRERLGRADRVEGYLERKRLEQPAEVDDDEVFEIPGEESR